MGSSADVLVLLINRSERLPSASEHLNSLCMPLGRWITNHSVTVLGEIKSILRTALLLSFT